jgi:hypothetical protein
MPQNIRMKKVIATVNALAKLHNFCIDESNNSKEIPPLLDRDNNLMVNRDDGYVETIIVNEATDTALLTDLMNGVNHFDEVPTGILLAQYSSIDQASLPRTLIHNLIADGHWERP